MLAAGLSSRRLRFVVGAPAAARDASVVFLCVQTPQGADGAADLSYVEAVAREIAPVLAPSAVVVNKSTAPGGSTRFVQRALSEAGVVDGVTVASNPEFLREGQAVRDFLQPDRIVIGCEQPEAAVRVSELYKGIHAPVLVTDPASAEMIKYASNAFLATKVSFINAIASLCEAVDADIREVAIGMGYDERIGFQFLHPGPGYGGSCFPKDVAALMHTATTSGYEFGLLAGVQDVNAAQHERIVAKIAHAAGGPLAGAQVAVWGLTLKARSDERRDSPSIAIVRRLLADGASVRAFDPAAAEQARRIVPEVVLAADAYEAVTEPDVDSCRTDGYEFPRLDSARVRDLMKHAAVVDARNHLDPAAMRRIGFTYDGVGRR